MARDTIEPDAGEYAGPTEPNATPSTAESPAESEPTPVDDAGLSRRGYIKRAGAIGAAGLVSGVAGTGAATASDDYDVVEVDRGSTWTRRIGDGETIENLLIDISAPGASAEIKANGDGWLIENVGVRGAWGDQRGAFITPRVDAGGVGTIRNVYVECYQEYGIGIWLPRSHAGELRVEQTWIEGFPNNAIYASSAGKGSDGRGGSVVFRNCYHRNNNVANFRTGSPGCEMHNCVSVYDRRPADYPVGPGDVTVRGIWNRGFDLTVVDCDITIPRDEPGAGAAILTNQVNSTHPQADNAVTTLENTRIQGRTNTNSAGRIEGSSAGDPEDRVPEGCPTSPEAAASGTGSDADRVTDDDSADDREADDEDSESEDFPNSLEVVGSGERVVSAYTIEIDGEVTTSESLSAPLDENMDATDSTASGTVWGDGKDGYRFVGSIDSVDVDGPATVLVNGEEYDPDESTSDNDYSHAISIDGEGTDGVTEYAFSVSGDLTLVSEEETADGTPTVDDGEASGTVDDGVDTYHFSGQITGFTLNGTASVALDDR